MLCRYSSRAARDTKHWPRAKTNYNDLHSTRDSSRRNPPPMSRVPSRGRRRARAWSSDAPIHLPFFSFLESIPTLSPSLCLARSFRLLAQVRRKLGQRARPHQETPGWSARPRRERGGGEQGETNEAREEEAARESSRTI